jgi:diacylglycerol kinase (ATP)
MSHRVCVIVNPAAGRGRGGEMLPRITERFAEAGVGDVWQTTAKGSEREIAARAIRDGFETIVVVGGDGTTTNVANAILRSGISVRLAVMPAGTGNDFAKAVGTANADISAIVRLSTGNSDRLVDVGQVEDNYFLNCCGFGFDVAVLEEIDRNRWLRGNSVYLYTALTQLIGYRGIEAAVVSPRSSCESRSYLLVVVANTEYFGGMFRIAPGASIEDGMLDTVCIADMPVVRRASTLASAVRGTHVAREGCTIERAYSFDLAFPAIPSYETDGELHAAQTSRVTVSCCRSMLRVVTGPSLHR